MGWNTIKIHQPHPIFSEMQDESRFYFVHSYHLQCRNNEIIAATTYHGYEFVSVVAASNIVGTQFHPEKSHQFGMKLLKNWAIC